MCLYNFSILYGCRSDRFLTYRRLRFDNYYNIIIIYDLSALWHFCARAVQTVTLTIITMILSNPLRLDRVALFDIYLPQNDNKLLHGSSSCIWSSYDVLRLLFSSILIADAIIIMHIIMCTIQNTKRCGISKTR